mmetsp:Transcript_106541/g.306373  ORF Transcript_106541/g.306373 Transcript_106541/m.306373 type:complete len:219 (+) Transcript_106541:1377-2033(+)
MEIGGRRRFAQAFAEGCAHCCGQGRGGVRADSLALHLHDFQILRFRWQRYPWPRRGATCIHVFRHLQEHRADGHHHVYVPPRPGHVLSGVRDRRQDEVLAVHIPPHFDRRICAHRAHLGQLVSPHHRRLAVHVARDDHRRRLPHPLPSGHRLSAHHILGHPPMVPLGLLSCRHIRMMLCASTHSEWPLALRRRLTTMATVPRPPHACTFSTWSARRHS